MPKVNGTAVPSNPGELGELLNDAKAYAKIYADPEARQDFHRKYAQEMFAKDPELKAQLDEQIQMGVQQFITGDYDRRPRTAGGAPIYDMAEVPRERYAANRSVSKGKGAVYNRAAPGAVLQETVKEEDRFGSVGEYLRAIREEARPTTAVDRNELMQKLANVRTFQNSFSSEDPGSGGFLIPEILRSQLLELALESAIIRPRATVIPMNTLRVPIPTVDDTNHVSSVFGGVTFYWAEEAAALTESQATFGRVVLDAKKLTGFFKVPNELLADAPAFSAWFDNRIPVGLAYFEDVAFLTETGTGTPEGIVSAPANVLINRTANLYADLANMYQAMLPQSQPNAIWVMSFDLFSTLAQMQLSTANASPGIWVGGYAQADAHNAPPAQIFGRPVYFTEKTPKSGTTGDVLFIDPSYYLIGDRQAMAVASSDQFAFQNDQTAYRIIERVDGRPWLQTALTPHNNSSTKLSAFVQRN